MTQHTICQLEIDHLLADLHEAEAARIDALRQVSGYRQLAYVALQRIAELTAQNERLRKSVRGSLIDRFGGDALVFAKAEAA